MKLKRKPITLKEKTLNTYTTEEVNKKILEILKKCIENNIKIELTKKDFIKIVNIYYELYHKYDFNFLKDVIERSTNKIDFYKIMNMLDLSIY